MADAEGVDRTYACDCSNGLDARQPMYAPSDKQHDRPIVLKVWNGKEPHRHLSGRDRAAGELADGE